MRTIEKLMKNRPLIKKIELKVKPGYYGLFSNGRISGTENDFYLLMTYHISRKGGFGEPVTVDQCEKALRKENPNYVYKPVN